MPSPFGLGNNQLPLSGMLGSLAFQNASKVTIKDQYLTGSLLSDLNFTRGATATLGTTDAFGLAFKTGGSERMRLDSSGRLSIGVTSTTSPLHAALASAGAQSVVARFENLGTTTGSGAQIALMANTNAGVPASMATLGGIAENTTSSGAMTFGTNNAGSFSEKMRLTSLGSLGIGTTAPDAKLHINEANAITGNYGLRISNPGITAAFGEFTIDTVNGAIKLLASGGSYPITISTNSIERLRIDTSGNVGIGTSSLTYRLHVHNDVNTTHGVQITNPNSGSGATSRLIFGNDTNSSAAQIVLSSSTHSNAGALQILTTTATPIWFQTNNVERMRIDGSGAIGVGAAPSAWHFNMKAVEGTGPLGIAFASANTGGVRLVGNAFYDGTNWIYKTTGAAAQLNTGSVVAPFIFQYAASGTAGATFTYSEAMRIDIAGNLLIGTTTNPTGYKFVVQGGSAWFSNNIVMPHASASIQNDDATGASTLSLKVSNLLVTRGDGNVLGGFVSMYGLRVRAAKTPASATDTGTTGDVCWDANYIYVCVATNTWKRTAIATW